MKTISQKRWVISLFGVATVASLDGCTAINLADVAPSAAKGDIVECSKDENSAMLQGQVTVADFANSARMGLTVADVQKQLPPAMQKDPVVLAFLELTKDSLNQGVAIATKGPPPPTTYPTSISHSQMRDFARNVLLEEMKPAVSGSSSRHGAMPNPFVQYLTAYYQGNYVDRFGSTITKPALSLTVSDTDIANALSILVDYIIDSIDATPVWGTNPKPTNDGKTTFYPGGKTTEPTFLTVYYDPSNNTYQQLSAGKCGINVDKGKLLGTLGGAAADAGGTVSGLVHGSFGGFEVGLGFLGKFSFGDDQTLAAIVKTAASRLSARVTVASAWPTLAKMDYHPLSTPLEVPGK